MLYEIAQAQDVVNSKRNRYDFKDIMLSDIIIKSYHRISIQYMKTDRHTTCWSLHN